ncbi:MAG: hypothetical protein RSD51_03525 [Malacoplasma sp.]
MYNDTLNTSTSLNNINKVKKIKDDLINNYFFISDFLEAKKLKWSDENLINKIASIQSRLDFAMNFSITKIDSIISDLVIEQENEKTRNKQSINHDFFSPGNISVLNDEAKEEVVSKNDANFLSNLDFSDFQSIDDILMKKRKIVEIVDDENLELSSKSKNNSNTQSDTNVLPDDILFIDGKINDVEARIKVDIDQLKMENKFISDINDGLMVQLQNLTSRPIPNNNEVFETNTLYLNIEQNLENIIWKINELENNVLKIDHLGKKIDDFIQPSSEVKIVDDNSSELKDKINHLKKENDLYKRKFLSSINELETLKSQAAETSFHYKSNEDYIMNTSKKLANLENIISNQIDDFADIEAERNELVKLFENKIFDLQNRLNEKDYMLYNAESPSTNESAIPKAELENYFSLLLTIEDKLNNLNNNSLKKDDLNSLKDNLVVDREDETHKIMDYLHQKNNENFLKIKEDFIESYERINKSMSIKDNEIKVVESVDKNILNDDLKSKDWSKLEKGQEGIFDDDKQFNNDVLENNSWDSNFDNIDSFNEEINDKNNSNNNQDFSEDILENNLSNDNSIKWENAEKNNIIKEQSLDERILENNLIDDLETNINKLREFEKFLIDLSFEIDKFS